MRINFCVEHAFKFLYIIMKSIYRSLMLKPSPQEMAQFMGILHQLVTDLFDPDKPEIPDLQCKTFSRITAGFK